MESNFLNYDHLVSGVLSLQDIKLRFILTFKVLAKLNWS